MSEEQNKEKANESDKEEEWPDDSSQIVQIEEALGKRKKGRNKKN